jgi:hypothetical protein
VVVNEGAGDAVDGCCHNIDLDMVPISFSSVMIEQRVPKLELTVQTNGPALVGEWFHIHIKLTNNEEVAVSDVSAVASLEEANDPIIADTTRLTLDYK